jgi:riboflavin biosynthesis pyrimidine reductase
MRALEKAGARPLTCATGPDGKIDLFALMDQLAAMKINSIMVEGGARVITSFVNSRLIDQFIITIAPKLVGGLQVLNSSKLETAPYLNCEQVHYQHLGNDMIVWARPGWKAT